MILLGIISLQDQSIKPPYLWVTTADYSLGGKQMRRYTAHFQNENTSAGTLYYSTNGGSSYLNRSIGAGSTFDLDVLTLRRGERGVINIKAYLIVNGKTSTTSSHSAEVNFPL